MSAVAQLDELAGIYRTVHASNGGNVQASLLRVLEAYEAARPTEPAQSRAEVLEKRPVVFRVSAHGNWLYFEDEQDAEASATMHGTAYQGLYARASLSPAPKPQDA